MEEHPYQDEEPTLVDDPDEEPTFVAARGRGSFMTFAVAGAALIIVVVVGLILLFGGDDSDDEATAEPIEPVPAVVLTPIWDRIATLEADETVSEDDLQDIKTELDQLDTDKVSVEELNTILTDLENRFIDEGQLRDTVYGLLDTEEFGESVLGVISEANAQATQTQAAIECLVQPLPEFPSVTARTAPIDSAARADFIFTERNYRVIGRTTGELNTTELWWLINIDAENNITGWVRSDVVSESNVDNCLNIAIMPVR